MNDNITGKNTGQLTTNVPIIANQITKFLQRTTVIVTVSGGLMLPATSSFAIVSSIIFMRLYVQFVGDFSRQLTMKLHPSAMLIWTHCWHDNWCLEIPLACVRGSFRKITEGIRKERKENKIKRKYGTKGKGGNSYRHSEIMPAI